MANSEFGILAVVAALGLLLLLGRKDEEVFIGATTLQEIERLGNAMKPRPQGITPAPAAKPKPKAAPKLTSRFNPKTTFRPIRGVQTQQGSHVKQLHQSLVDTWNRTSPAAKQKIINSWIERARRVMRARILALIKQQQSGYRTVQYTGGFGGTIERGPGVTGAVGANTVDAWEEALGLKPITNSSKISPAQKKLSQTANDSIGQYAKCEGDKACQTAAAKKFDAIVFAKTTALINSMRLQNKGADPTQSMV